MPANKKVSQLQHEGRLSRGTHAYPGANGVQGTAARRSLAGAQASQGGLPVRPAKGVGSRRCLRRGGVGGGGVGPAVVASLNHAPWSMTYRQTSALSVSW